MEIDREVCLKSNHSLFRHSGGLLDGREGRDGRDFRHLLGLDTITPTPARHKPRTMKDSKEIMKKRRERAICIVSIRA